jgi:hypothetical protein
MRNKQALAKKKKDNIIILQTYNFRGGAASTFISALLEVKFQLHIGVLLSVVR